MPGPHSRRSAHPYLVAGLAELPDDLQPLAGQQALESGGPPEAIFVVPQQLLPQRLDNKEILLRLPAQAPLFKEDELVYLRAADDSGQPGQVISLRAERLFYARLTLILLYGRLEFYGLEDGALNCIRVEYNTVAHDLIQPALQRFLRRAWDAPAKPGLPDSDRTQTLMQELRRQSFKFGNGLAHYGLLPGEHLQGFVFQPRIKQKIFGPFHRQVAPAALLALTEHECIVIEEGRTNPTSYGWSILFCPRQYLSGVESLPNAEWLNMSFHLAMESHLADHQVMLEQEAAQDWLTLWSSRD